MTWLSYRELLGGIDPRPLSLWLIGGILLIYSLCFCSAFPAVLFFSTLFNTILLGSSLFACLAQEREKRTIDALRLTQLTSLDILLLKSRMERRLWAWGNLVFAALLLISGFVSEVPLDWILCGILSTAANGLLSIALALAVSTRSETTSIAVVRGWILKAVWLVGLPLLDGVVAAVFVMKANPSFFRYLDPAWTAISIGEVAFLEPSAGGATVLTLLLAAVVSVALAWGLVSHSSRLIDASFESAPILHDRKRHESYRKTFMFSLHENPFFVRELAWQLRSGAGRWPGYVVFLTIFIAPFLYGLAQSSKGEEAEPVRVLKQDLRLDNQLSQWSERPVSSMAGQHLIQAARQSGMATSNSTLQPKMVHGHICLSRLFGLPIETNSLGSGKVKTWMGKVSLSSVDDRDGRPGTKKVSKSAQSQDSQSPSDSFENHLRGGLSYGLVMGLALGIVYLFIRGGAFLAGSITGERERRAWDQVALTGVDPTNFMIGKLAAVLGLPLWQLLCASPALLLFVAYDVITFWQFVLIVTLLFVCLVMAGTLGILCSALLPTSHQAQGWALGAGLALLLLPLIPRGHLLVILLLFLLLYVVTSLQARWGIILFSMYVPLGWIAGKVLSPLGAISDIGSLMFGEGNGVMGKGVLFVMGVRTPLDPIVLVTSILATSLLALYFFWLAYQALEDRGSVKA